MNAEKYGLERIYFGGCFIRGNVVVNSGYVMMESSPRLTQAMRPRLRPCRMRYGFGAKGPSGPCSFDTRGSCKWHAVDVNYLGLIRMQGVNWSVDPEY